MCSVSAEYDQAVAKLKEAADVDGRLAESYRAQGIAYFEKKDLFVIAKASTTFLLAVLGLFTSIAFLSMKLIDKDFLSYYLIAFGLISLIEPFLRILVNNHTVKKYLIKESKNTKKEVKEKVKISPKSKVKPLEKKKKVVKDSVKK